MKAQLDWRCSLQEIEATAGLTISVLQDPLMLTAASVNFHFPVGSQGGRTEATIWHRDPVPEPAVMWHEIEHCRRYLVEGIHMLLVRPEYRLDRRDTRTGELLPDTPCAAFTPAWLDNELEHLTIEPRLAAMGFDRRPHLEEVFRSRWGMDYDASAARFRLLDWVSTALFLPEHSRIVRTARDMLRGAGLWGEAEPLPEQVKPTLPSKEATLLVVLSKLKIYPPGAALFVHVPTGRARPLRREVTFQDATGGLVKVKA